MWMAKGSTDSRRESVAGLYRSLRAGGGLAHAGRLVGFGFVRHLLHVADIHVAGPVGRVPHLVLPFEVSVCPPVIGLVERFARERHPPHGAGNGDHGTARTHTAKTRPRHLVVSD